MCFYILQHLHVSWAQYSYIIQRILQLDHILNLLVIQRSYGKHKLNITQLGEYITPFLIGEYWYIISFIIYKLAMMASIAMSNDQRFICLIAYTRKRKHDQVATVSCPGRSTLRGWRKCSALWMSALDVCGKRKPCWLLI